MTSWPKVLLVLCFRAPFRKSSNTGPNTGLALHRLQHDGGGLVVQQRLDRVDVIPMRLHKTGHGRWKQGIPACFAAGGHGGRYVGSGSETTMYFHGIFLRRNYVHVYVRQKKFGGRFKTRIDLVRETKKSFTYVRENSPVQPLQTSSYVP